MRVSMRTFTRLTNGFPKKLKNQAHAIPLYCAHYDFWRPHQTLDGRTPALAAEFTGHRWTVAELLSNLDLKQPWKTA